MVFMKTTHYKILILGLLLFSCENKEKPIYQMKQAEKPEIKDNGVQIIFASLPPHFETWYASKRSLEGNVAAPAKVAASIYAGAQDDENKIILFENPDITELYSAYLQSVSHFNRDTEFYNRVQDMYKNGASTGKELLEAKTGMLDAQNEKLEQETRLRVFGYKPSELKSAPPNTAWIVANVAEPDLKHIKVGASCNLEFNSYDDDIFQGKVVAIGEVLNTNTRTINVRIALPNKEEKFKPGMFAEVNFGISESDKIAVPNTALVTVEGKTYIFKRNGNKISRSEVSTEKQLGEYTILKSGVQEGDSIVISNVILLKGFSFGY
jgi:membrane fusion protein, heavy metal efflux system